MTGDGDGLSIGGNHLLHALRRNIGLKILLFNNEIYGLTKGQYSPTSRKGTRSPSSPTGSFDAPVSPGLFAIGAGAGFIARAVDTDKVGLGKVLEATHKHAGATFVEIFQNCIVYNEDVFSNFTDRATAAETQIHVQHGEPLVFGKNKDKGIAFDISSFSLKVVDANSEAAEVLVHDETNMSLAQLLLQMNAPEFPVAMGVVYRIQAETFEAGFYAKHPTAMKRTVHVADVIRRTNTWTVT